MNAPLWFEWRWMAIKQWIRDARGLGETSGTHMKLVRCNSTREGHHFTCEFCGASYGDTVTFQEMVAHIVRHHPDQGLEAHQWIGKNI